MPTDKPRLQRDEPAACPACERLHVHVETKRAPEQHKPQSPLSWYWVQCPCGVRGPLVDDHQNAIAAWNAMCGGVTQFRVGGGMLRWNNPYEAKPPEPPPSPEPPTPDPDIRAIVDELDTLVHGTLPDVVAKLWRALSPPEEEDAEAQGGESVK